MGYFDRLVRMSRPSVPAGPPVTASTDEQPPGRVDDESTVIAIPPFTPRPPSQLAGPRVASAEDVRAPETSDGALPVRVVRDESAAPPSRPDPAESPLIAADHDTIEVPPAPTIVAAPDRPSRIERRELEEPRCARPADARVAARCRPATATIPPDRRVAERVPAPQRPQATAEAARHTVLHAVIEKARRWVSKPPRAAPAPPTMLAEPSRKRELESAWTSPPPRLAPVVPYAADVERPVDEIALQEPVRPARTAKQENVELSIGTIHVTIEGSQELQRTTTRVKGAPPREPSAKAERGRHLRAWRYYVRS